jgi:diguanylate cyclase (GGDEF)-like protein/PAS domain S-box-containing protein
LLDPKGDIVGYYGYLTDITERHEKEELFRLLVETNPNAVLIYDFYQNKILYANANTAKLTGYSLEELLNLENPIELIHPDDRYKVIESVNKRKQGYKRPISYYMRLLRKDGRLRYVKLMSIVTRYKGEDVSFITLNDITKEIRRERKYRKLATIDPLTKVYNRYVLFSTLEHLIEYAERYGEIFSVIIFDIDNFKLLNDTYGHLVGDSVLKSIAKEIKRVIRRSDILGRYGGEEFLIILPKTKDPYSVAEKIRKVIESMDLEKGIRVTISVGGTVYKKGDTVDSIISRADEALYLAKQSGKNQTVIL